MTPEASRDTEGAAKAWVLTNGHPGNTTQVVGLAEALGLPYEIKVLRFRAKGRLGQLILRLLPGNKLLRDRESAALRPPWPELVIGVGRSTAAVTRWLGRRSATTRTVQLGRGGGAQAWRYDAVVSPVHCRMPPHPRRFETIAPLNPVSPAQLAAARQEWPHLFDGLPSPRIVLLVGGDAPRFAFSPATATRLGGQVRKLAAAAGGSVTAVTSRRTSREAAAALEEALGPQHRLHRWHPAARDNPYLGYLAGAEVLVVTAESESMLGEAASTTLPLYLFPLPERPPGWAARLKEWVNRQALRCYSGQGPGVVGTFCSGLIKAGLVLPRRDITLMHRSLIAAGRAEFLGDSLDLAAKEPLLEAAVVADWLRKKLGLGANGQDGREQAPP